ncbi:hypothetical protein SaSA20_0680a [Streptococcus agalactiae]|nr:hypothetical protein SaSA20_0680a [Streptococcus agalactiae]
MISLVWIKSFSELDIFCYNKKVII